VCGREKTTTAEKAFDDGWDFGGPGGLYPLGVVSPRTCPRCAINKTVWWRLAIEHTRFAELSSPELEVVARILREAPPAPGSPTPS